MRAAAVKDHDTAHGETGRWASVMHTRAASKVVLAPLTHNPVVTTRVERPDFRPRVAPTHRRRNQGHVSVRRDVPRLSNRELTTCTDRPLPEDGGRMPAHEVSVELRDEVRAADRGRRDLP